MSIPPDPREGICSLLLLLAIPAEEKGLKQAAQACGLPFVKVRAGESRLTVDYFHLGPIENETGVIALPPAKDADDNLAWGRSAFSGRPRGRCDSEP